MRILINASTIVIGGGIQVAVSFISHAINDLAIYDYIFAISKPIYNNLSDEIKNNERIKLIDISPANPIRGMKSRRLLRSLELKYKPDLVFTIFGPSYIRFNTKHACGSANPWLTHPSRVAFASLNPIFRIYNSLISAYKRRRLSNAKYYWVETDVAKQGLINKLKILPSKINIIPNAISTTFIGSNIKVMKKNHNKFIVLCIAAPYSHKNLSIIPEILSILKNKKQYHYQFVVTLPDNGFEVKKFWNKATKFSVTNMIKNIGVVKISECPIWYDYSDAVLLPSLLETFSVTYLEAMMMNKPIITTDLDFAHDICGDAALYYNPLSASSAADAIEKLSTNNELCSSLINKGILQLNKYPSSKEKYLQTVQWLVNLINSN